MRPSPETIERIAQNFTAQQIKKEQEAAATATATAAATVQGATVTVQQVIGGVMYPAQGFNRLREKRISE